MSVAELPVMSDSSLQSHAAKPFSRPDPYADPPSDVLFEVVNGARVGKPMSVFEAAPTAP